jgi:hypothetical protein
MFAFVLSPPNDPPNPTTLQGIGAGITELLKKTTDGFASTERKIQGVKDDIREVRTDVQQLYTQQMETDVRLDKIEDRLNVVEGAPIANETTEVAARAAETVARHASEAARAVASAATGALRRTPVPLSPGKVSLATASEVVLASIPPPKKHDLGVQFSDSGLHVLQDVHEYKRGQLQVQAAAALARERWVIHKGLGILALVAAAFFGTLAKDCAKTVVHKASHVEEKP